MSRDITYCGYSNCPYTDCERHATHSKGTYDSFAYFHDCDKYPPKEFPEEKLLGRKKNDKKDN